MAGLAKKRRMAKRKIEALQSFLGGNYDAIPLLSQMGMREINDSIARIKLAQLQGIIESNKAKEIP
jgi:hypothetical protein